MLTGFRFKPKLFSLALVLVGLSITLSASWWQWNKGIAVKKLLQSHIQNSKTVPIEALLGDLDSTAQVRFHILQKVELTGNYLPQYTFFLDNQIMDHSPGWYQMVPFQLVNSPTVIVVARTWLPMPASRQVIPKIDMPLNSPQTHAVINNRTGQVIQGILLPAPKNPWVGNQKDKNVGSLATPEQQVWQSFDASIFTQRTGLKTVPLIVLQTTPGTNADPSLNRELKQNWQLPILNPDKNFNYSGQWLFFSFLLILALVLTSFERIPSKQ